MSRLQPGKLHVRLIVDQAPDAPVMPRRYTLTHSDTSGDLFFEIHFQSHRQRYRRKERRGTPADFRL